MSPINGFRKIFQLQKNTGEDKYKIIPLNTNTINIVLNTSSLYLDGFITNKNNIKTYWHFKQDKNNNNITQIEGIESKQLPYTGHYSKIRNSDLTISKNSINQSIDNLANFNGENSGGIKDSLLTTIFTTSESIRFFSVRDKVEQILNNNSSVKWSEYESKIKDWKKYSKKYYKRIKTGHGSDTKDEHDKIFDIAVLAPKDDEE